MLVPVTIEEVMSPSVETIAPDVDAVEVARLLCGRGIGSVVVVVEGEPVGIVTESDMVDLVAAEHVAAEQTASDCMSTPVVTIDTDASIEDAVDRFREHDIKKLPVMADGSLAGIVTTTDVTYYIPHLTRGAAEYTRPSADRHHRERVDTAYEREEWTFESIGEHDDRIEVGDVVKFTKTLSKGDVEAFAEAGGDTNRLHLDTEYAEGSRFGRPIAHGTLVGGVISAALARLPGLIVYLSQDMSYLGPVDIGEEVTAVCEVVEALGRERYRLTTTVVDGDGEEVIDGEAVVIADPIPDTA